VKKCAKCSTWNISSWREKLYKIVTTCKSKKAKGLNWRTAGPGLGRPRAHSFQATGKRSCRASLGSTAGGGCRHVPKMGQVLPVRKPKAADKSVRPTTALARKANLRRSREIRFSHPASVSHAIVSGRLVSIPGSLAKTEGNYATLFSGDSPLAAFVRSFRAGENEVRGVAHVPRRIR
jgi:hypothetical protein